MLLMKMESTIREGRRSQAEALTLPFRRLVKALPQGIVNKVVSPKKKKKKASKRSL